MQVEGAQGWEAGGPSDKAVTIPNVEAAAVEVERDSWDLMMVRTSNYWEAFKEVGEEEQDEWQEEDVRCKICDERGDGGCQADGCEECGPFIEVWPSLKEAGVIEIAEVKRTAGRYESRGRNAKKGKRIWKKFKGGFEEVEINNVDKEERQVERSTSHRHVKEISQVGQGPHNKERVWYRATSKSLMLGNL